MRKTILPLIAAFALASASVHAASTFDFVTPQKMSVVAGESAVFQVRFYNASGSPAGNELVAFSNDACGRFTNGQFNYTATTDTNGLASAVFTALQTGFIGCRLFAIAGAAQARFDVITYPLSTANVTATIDPPEPRPGQSFRIAARAKVGIYDIYNADITARVVAGTASAAVSPATLNSGQDGGVTFDVTPGARLGDYEIELDFRGRTNRVAVKAPANPWQDLWWSGPEENGWGMSVVQHRDVLFAIVYAYDGAGQPIWYVMPSGTWNEAHTAYTGSVYVPKGSPYISYDATKFDIGAPVGNATLTFNNLADNATLDYTINGVSGRKFISRIPFGEGGAAPPGHVGDLWWSGIQQNGWGIAMLQQGRTLFSLWFTYDANGTATWFVMPGGFWMDSKTYQGPLYRPTGSPWLGQPYDRTQHRLADLGVYTLQFAADGTASFVYSMPGGTSLTLPLTRIPF